MLYFTDKAFNQMSFTIQVPVIFATQLFIRPRRNNHRCSVLDDRLDELFRIITFVGNQSFKNETVNQIVCLAVVALLTARQDKSECIAERITRQMNLGRKATATSA